MCLLINNSIIADDIMEQLAEILMPPFGTNTEKQRKKALKSARLTKIFFQFHKKPIHGKGFEMYKLNKIKIKSI